MIFVQPVPLIQKIQRLDRNPANPLILESGFGQLSEP